MSRRRKLLAGVAAALVLAGAATGGAIAAGGQTSPSTAPRLVQGKSLLAAAAAYLGIQLPALKHELRPGHPLAAIASTTPGRTVDGLRAALLHDAFANLRKDEASMSRQRTGYVHAWLRKRMAGFVAGTCPLNLGRLFVKLGGSCPGMSM